MKQRSGALAAVIATLFWTSPGAVAEPTPDPAPPAVNAGLADAPTLSLMDLGAGGTVPIVVNRNIAAKTLNFAVPSGLTPVALKAGLDLPVNLRFGNLVITQGDRVIGKSAMPAPDQPQLVDIPLSGVQVFGNWVNLTVTVNVIAMEGYCWDRMSPIRLINGEVVFAGVEVPPATVADFIPPVMRKATIALPANPSQAESNAAIQLAAEVANRNGQSPEVAVVPLPDGADNLPNPPAPLERQFIVKEGPEKGLWLQGGGVVPALRVSGPGNELTGQVRLLADAALPLAASRTSVNDPLPEPESASDNTTLEELTGSGLTAEELWPTAKIVIDQTTWGHPIGGVTVHLIGSYTPLPTNFGGEVTVTVGGETIARWPAEADGVIDRTVRIPDRLLKRVTNLELGVRSTGNPGNCGDHLPIMLRLDGTTSIQLHDADPPMPQGFQSLPQSLMPTVRVGLGTDAFGDTARAAQIIVGLQRASASPLTTEVSGLQDAIASNEPAVLVSTEGWDNNVIPLPFTTDKGRLTVTGLNPRDQEETLNLDPAAAFGSLQTVFDGRRTVLIATSSGSPEQLDGLLRYLAFPGRWQGLNGRAIIAAPGMEPVTVPNPPIDYSAGTQESPQPDQDGNWFWWVVGGVAALAATGAVAILLRYRRT